MKYKTIITMVFLIIAVITVTGIVCHYDNKCIERGHDGVVTMGLIYPVGCYDNNNPLGVNDKRGYEFHNLFYD